MRWWYSISPKKYAFPPNLTIGGSDVLSEVTSSKLLGVVIQSSLRWEENTVYICKKATSKIWALRKMQKIGIEIEILADVYIKEIRSVLEFGAPVWHSGLTLSQSKDIEFIQRLCTSVILNDWKLPYFVRCTLLDIEPLYMRRPGLVLAFSKRAEKRTNQDVIFFSKKISHYERRSNCITFNEHQCNNSRFYKSPLPYMTRELNKEYALN